MSEIRLFYDIKNEVFLIIAVLQKYGVGSITESASRKV